MALRVIIADDHRIMREGLHALLEKECGIEIIAEAEDGRTTVELCREHKPDIVIMDITMPCLNGIEATRQIVAELPTIKVIGLSMHSNKKFIGEMLSAGASGYLLKDSAFEELITAIFAVSNNRFYIGSQLTGVEIDEYLKKDGTTSTSPLTDREREVLQLLSEGKTTRQIAFSLKVSAKTVATHRSQIMLKLGFKSVAQLTKYAINEGLTSVEV